uniref:Uncharacterized protein n=1 Tax=Timema genevievae TaxID=629358 RepID=A0A7R9JW69_TIMGE|nr:unnamed protein product [Timema genevievae]
MDVFTQRAFRYAWLRAHSTRCVEHQHGKIKQLALKGDWRVSSRGERGPRFTTHPGYKHTNYANTCFGDRIVYFLRRADTAWAGGSPPLARPLSPQGVITQMNWKQIVTLKIAGDATELPYTRIMMIPLFRGPYVLWFYGILLMIHTLVVEWSERRHSHKILDCGLPMTGRSGFESRLGKLRNVTNWATGAWDILIIVFFDPLVSFLPTYPLNQLIGKVSQDSRGYIYKGAIQKLALRGSW